MKKIDAIRMLHKIRDRKQKELAGKSTQEMIRYFREKADILLKTKDAASDVCL